MGLTTRLYGLTIRSPRALGRPAEPHLPVDVVIEFDDRPADQTAPIDGAVVVLDPGEPARYLLVRRSDGSSCYRIPGLADVDIDADWCRFDCRMVPGADPTVLDVVLAGHVLATRMSARGDVVLHASAIEADGDVIGLVGYSGGGKSTLAAMACLAGARLLTDDVLRVRVEEGAVWCSPGVSHLRLRPTSKLLMTGDDVGDVMSGDGRHLFSPELAADRDHRLRRLVLPRLVVPEGHLLYRRVPPAVAMVQLMWQLRVLGWRDVAIVARHFDGLADLVERIPVYVLDVPWGVEAGGLGEPLLELLTRGDD